MKNSIWLLLLIFSLYSCNDDDKLFNVSPEGLEVKFTPVAGGAMMHYTLPDNRDIFAMNVRYTNSQGQKVLKTCGYSGDSLLLDGFTQAHEVTANISFVNRSYEESESREYQFKTLDSAPWAFFNDIQVASAWSGFQVIYKSPSVVTGMAHVFYLGTNPLTNEPDTILVNSFPISRGGDTLVFKVQQERPKNTIIIRTEDFQGFRVRQEVYPDIDAFLSEQWTMTASDFISGPTSVENSKAKTGVQYLFDGELRGRERFLASTHQNPITQPSTEIFASYLAGPNALNKPIILDLREQKTPAWIRMYALCPMHANEPAGPNAELGTSWNGCYEDKLPCQVTVYGNKNSSDPEDAGWEYLGRLNQDPYASTEKDKWTYKSLELMYAPKTVDELDKMDPYYVDISFPALNNTYRYLKIMVHDTFRKRQSSTNTNRNAYFTLHELEIFVKKN